MIEQLRQARITARLKQKDAAEILGVSQSEYSKIETGIRQKIPPGEIEMLIERIKKLR